MKKPTYKCGTLLERLSSYVDGDLAPADRRAMLAHLRRCPCCKRLADGLTHTADICREAGHAKLPAAVRARARARVTELLASNK
jgi:anti-sigma factor RsiW